MYIRLNQHGSMRTVEQTEVEFSQTEFHVCRIRAGYRSQEALARAAGLSGGYLRSVAGGFIPPEHTRQRIAQALKVAPEALWRVRAA